MGKQRNRLHQFVRCNRGSGLIMVLMSMFCISLLGSAMLTMSYTGVRIKSTQRQAEKDFYSAEIAMDEVRAGLQGLVSKAIATSYKYILINYSNGENVVSRFQKNFQNEILKAPGGLFTNNTTYSATKLKDFINNASVEVTGAAGSTGSVEVDEAKGTVTLKKVKVSYTASNGYVTDIVSDLVINAPDFRQVLSAQSISGLPEHAFIARDKLTHNGGDALIALDGSAYAGSIEVMGQGSQLTLRGGSVVSANNVTVHNDGKPNQPRFLVENNTVLWAGGIEVKGGGSFFSRGTVKVLDDLDLSGSKAKATIQGSYYGFGNGSPDPNRAGDSTYVLSNGKDPKRSSSILVNGRDSVLDISGASNVVLAGRTYISDSFTIGRQIGQYVETPESLSIRSDQNIYLMPTMISLVEGSSPISVLDIPDGSPYRGGEVPNPCYAAVQAHLPTLQDGIKFLADTIFYGQVKEITIPAPGGSGWIRYWLIDVGSTPTGRNEALINKFYDKYFKENGNYLDTYLAPESNLTFSSTGDSTIASAGWYASGKGTTYSLKPGTTVSNNIDEMRTTFDQLKKTLIDSNANADSTDPYEYIVNTKKLKDLPMDKPVYFYNIDGKPVGVVVNGSYTIGESTLTTYPTLSLVLASGDVTVEKDFEGLIISGKTIALAGTKGMTVSANKEKVSSAFLAEPKDDAGIPKEALATYFLKGTFSAVGNEGADSGWNLDQLVAYRSWTKNG